MYHGRAVWGQRSRWRARDGVKISLASFKRYTDLAKEHISCAPSQCLTRNGTNNCSGGGMEKTKRRRKGDIGKKSCLISRPAESAGRNHVHLKVIHSPSIEPFPTGLPRVDSSVSKLQARERRHIFESYKAVATERSPLLRPRHQCTIIPALPLKAPPQEAFHSFPRWLDARVGRTHESLPQILKAVSRMWSPLDSKIEVLQLMFVLGKCIVGSA